EVDADAGGAQPLDHPGDAGSGDGRSRAELPRDPERDLTIIDVFKTLAISWHNRMKMFVDLAPQRDGLLDQVPAMPRQELEADRDRIGWRFEPAEAIDGAPLDGGHVGLIGRVTGVGELPMLLGGQGMNDSGLESRLGEGPRDGAVRASGPLDDDDRVPDRGPIQGRAKGLNHGLEAGLVVFHLGGS